MKRTITYKDNKRVLLFILCFVIISPNVLLIAVKVIQADIFGFLRACYSLLISLSVLLFVPILLRHKVKKYFLALSPLYPLISVVIYVMLIYERTPSRWMVYALINADKPEIVEFISGMNFVLVLSVLIPILLIGLALKLESYKLELAKKHKITFLLAFVFLLLISYGYNSYQSKTLKTPLKSVLKTSFKDTPVYTAVRTVKALRSHKHSKIAIGTRAVGAYSKNNKDQKELYVLIIGESSRYKNWSINGYSKETSSNLDTISRLRSYSNVVSSGFLTEMCIPLMLTTASLSGSSMAETSPNIISIFREAGFTTCWIGNQQYSGNAINNLAIHADDFFTVNCKSSNCYDDLVVSKFEEYLANDYQKMLVLIHLKGSHYPYYKRYPEQFNRFKPSLSENQHINKSERHKEKLINSYDNSIVYTDHIISSCLNLMKRDSVYGAAVYLSDHGEDLFDSGNSGFGRGLGELVPELYHIPFFVWTTKKYEAENIRLCTSIDNNYLNKVSSENLIYSLSELAHITWNDMIPDLSFFTTDHQDYKRYIQTNTKIESFDYKFKSYAREISSGKDVSKE